MQRPSPAEALKSLDDMLRARRPWLISANGAKWTLARCDSRHEAIAEAIRRFSLVAGERILIGRVEWSQWQDGGNEDLNPMDVEEVLVESERASRR